MINKDALLFIPANKSNNPYKVRRLQQDNITKLYKKANVTLIKNIKKEAKTTAVQFNLENRIEQLNQREAFLPLKDHKVNLKSDPTCRLIKPAKSEIGVISKHYLERNNNKIREKTQVNQWRNIQSVIE